MIQLHTRYGLEINPLFNILECLVVMLMYMFQRKIRVSWIIKLKKCIFMGYKYGVKHYKLWNLETKKIVYSRDVVFKEVKYVSKHEFLPMQDEPKK